jgi:DNA-binding NarL/FixJ family response regulator
MLERHPEYRVVGEASDGHEAIQKAAKLQPDLVLLDINLPTLSGLEVAPQIQRLSSSKIIFLTQEPSAEVVEEALRAGAHGYVLKVDAGSELLAAMEAVRRGERYVSRRLRAQLATEAEPRGRLRR